jgi:FlaA1/EpsC-like NDP-sugar epimerase
MELYMNEILNKKIESMVFGDYVENILSELQGKKVLIYGAGLAYEKLNKKFDFKKLNIVGISDLKFESIEEINGLITIPPREIDKYDFDVILLTLIYPAKALECLKGSLKEHQEVKCLFDDILPQESEFIEYLEKIKFTRHLDKISKKLKSKKVVLYGSGLFFQVINTYYDLSKLNIVAIADRKYSQHEKDEKFMGYKVCGPDEIKDLSPDYVLVATRFFINLIEDLESTTLKKTKIKVRPLIKKPFRELWQEIWG